MKSVYSSLSEREYYIEAEVMEVSIFKLPVVIRKIIDHFIIDLECSTIVTDAMKRLEFCDDQRNELLLFLQEKKRVITNVKFYAKYFCY